MDTKRMPIALVLLVASWLIAIFGLVAAGYLIIYRYDDTYSLVISFLILLGALFLAGVSRMLGNMGQGFFELKNVLSGNLRTIIERLTTIDQKSREHFKEQLQAIRESTQNQVMAIKESTQLLSDNFTSLSHETQDRLNKSLSEINAVIKEQLLNIYNNLSLVKNALEQVGCDSKDVSQNIYQIKSFFEQIEKHLDLKK